MKIAVTGWAWRTPLGNTVEEGMKRLLAGERAAREHHHFDASTFECRVAAPISGKPAPTKQAKFLKRMALFGVEVAREALQSGTGTQVPGDRVGVFFGYGGLRAEWEDLMPALAQQHESGKNGWNQGFQLLHPFWILRHLSNNSHAIAAEELQLTGEGVTFAGANAGAQAVSGAIAALRAGVIDKALVVAHDSLIEPETLVAFSSIASLATQSVAELVASYDARGTGYVPGEAAAAIILERADAAGARALAYVEAADSAGGQEGEPGRDTIAHALARVARGGVLVDGAGRGTGQWDGEERAVVAEFVGAEAPLVCTLGSMGNVGSASALVQLISLTSQLRGGELAPVAGLKHQGSSPLRPVLTRTSSTARCGIALCTGAPGLVGVIRVELPEDFRR